MDFLKSKFDNISLLVVLILLATLLLHIVHHHEDDAVLAWIEQTFTTVLGAYIGLTQAARISWNKPNGNGGTNVTPPSPTVVAGTTLPTYPKS